MFALAHENYRSERAGLSSLIAAACSQRPGYRNLGEVGISAPRVSRRLNASGKIGHNNDGFLQFELTRHRLQQLSHHACTQHRRTR